MQYVAPTRIALRSSALSVSGGVDRGRVHPLVQQRERMMLDCVAARSFTAPLADATYHVRLLVSAGNPLGVTVSPPNDCISGALQSLAITVRDRGTGEVAYDIEVGRIPVD